MQYQNATAQPREELNDVVMESVTTDEMFRGLTLLPAKPMTLPTGHVPKILVGSGNLMRAARKNRAPGSNFDRWQSAIGELNFTLVQVPEEILLPDEQTFIYEDYFAFESYYAMEATNRLRRGHELDVETAVFDTGTFNATAALVAYTNANIATINFPGDVIAAIRTVKARGEMPNTIAIPGQLFDRIRLATLTQSYVAGAINPGAIVTQSTLAQAFADFGIMQVLVMDSYVNTSDAQNADSIDAIWPNTYFFVGNCQPGELKTGGIGRTMFWEKEGPIFNIQSYRDENRKSNVIRAMKTTQAAITNARAGQLVTTSYA